MFKLTTIFDKEKDSFDFQGQTLYLDMTFDNILRLFELFTDDTIPSFEKVLIALEMLIYEYEVIEELPFKEQFEIYNFLLKEFLHIDVSKKEQGESEEASTPSKKVMDFTKDAELIYASFLSEYQIDLFQEHDKLHWDKFSALMSNLGDNTAFKQIVSYRTMKVPSAKEASEEYRSHVQKMKRLYSLEDETEQAENLENTLDTIASTFKGGG